MIDNKEEKCLFCGARFDSEVKLVMVLTVVNMLLQDVAEKPERLERAMEIAKRDIPPLLK